MSSWICISVAKDFDRSVGAAEQIERPGFIQIMYFIAWLRVWWAKPSVSPGRAEESTAFAVALEASEGGMIGCSQTLAGLMWWFNFFCFSPEGKGLRVCMLCALFRDRPQGGSCNLRTG
jgi:hypothetical protein